MIEEFAGKPMTYPEAIRLLAIFREVEGPMAGCECVFRSDYWMTAA